MSSVFCTSCRKVLGPEDVFEDGETRPFVIHDSDTPQEHLVGPLCMRCFRREAGLSDPSQHQDDALLANVLRRAAVDRWCYFDLIGDYAVLLEGLIVITPEERAALNRLIKEAGS